MSLRKFCVRRTSRMSLQGRHAPARKSTASEEILTECGPNWLRNSSWRSRCALRQASVAAIQIRAPRPGQDRNGSRREGLREAASLAECAWHRRLFAHGWDSPDRNASADRSSSDCVATTRDGRVRSNREVVLFYPLSNLRVRRRGRLAGRASFLCSRPAAGPSAVARSR